MYKRTVRNEAIVYSKCRSCTALRFEDDADGHNQRFTDRTLFRLLQIQQSDKRMASARMQGFYEKGFERTYLQNGRRFPICHSVSQSVRSYRHDPGDTRVNGIKHHYDAESYIINSFSRSSVYGLSMPCVIMFIAPILLRVCNYILNFARIGCNFQSIVI